MWHQFVVFVLKARDFLFGHPQEGWSQFYSITYKITIRKQNGLVERMKKYEYFDKISSIALQFRFICGLGCWWRVSGISMTSKMATCYITPRILKKMSWLLYHASFFSVVASGESWKSVSPMITLDILQNVTPHLTICTNFMLSCAKQHINTGQGMN